MAGHSKWSNIKRKKAVVDAKRGKVFTKLIKEIMVAARMGGGDPESNPRLRSAIQTSRGSNLPNDKIERAIQRGAGELEGVNYEEVTYEGYGPEGVALLVDALTDNVNRTVAEVRSSFNKRDGKMGAPGSVGYLFDEKGQIRLPKSGVDYETIFEAAVEAGAEEVEDAEDDWLITTAREDLYLVGGALEDAGLTASEVQLAKLPQTTVDITDLATAKKIMALIEHLEDNEDVQTVWTNFDLSDEVAASLEAE